MTQAIESDAVERHCGQVVRLNSWRSPRTAKVVIIRTYKHGDGFLGVDAHSEIGRQIIQAVESQKVAELSKETIAASYEAAKHYYDTEIRS